MKRLVLVVLNAVIWLLGCFSHAAEAQLKNPYVVAHPFKSAVVHYTIRNNYGHGAVLGGTLGVIKTFVGTEVLSIKGDKHAKLLRMTLPGAKGTSRNVETLQIFTPAYIYEIDLATKTGTKIDNPRRYEKEAYDRLSTEEKRVFNKRLAELGIMSRDLLEVGAKVGSEIVLGYPCDVYESGQKFDPERPPLEMLQGGPDPVYVKSWLWRGSTVPLRIMVSGLGWSQEIVATVVEKDEEIPDNRFTVPADVATTYDEERSRLARLRSLAAFERIKTGKPQVIRMKVEKRVRKLQENPATGAP